MYELLGACELADTKTVSFQLFFPDENLNPLEYDSGGAPRIKEIYVVGDFQSKLGLVDWTPHPDTQLKSTPYPGQGNPIKGNLYSLTTAALPDGFYQYKYAITFNNGEKRIVSDPCSRYGGKEIQNSGFVVGGRKIPVVKRHPAPLPPKDLIIYELMIDDFTAPFLNGRAPLDAVTDKLDYLVDLGINAIEFMPWTAWPSFDFSWGYNPFAYFSVAHKYTLDPTDPTNKIVYLKQLINECHDRKLHVLLDGVFNHADGSTPYLGFSYYWFYQDTSDCPYVGRFEQAAYFQDLDYANRCTQEFIFDVCKYWIEVFQIDGIRFDNTLGYYRETDRSMGIPKLLSQLRTYLDETGRDNFTLTLEHAWDYTSIDVVNRVGATSCWYDKFRGLSAGFLQQKQIQSSIMRMLNSGRDFQENRYATIYLENHDHETFMVKASSRDEWWRTQPYVIALFTCPGAVLIHNGQEFGQNDWLPEDDTPTVKRVQPRPLNWNFINDAPGTKTRDLYKQMIALREAHAGLRSNNFYPNTWDESQVTLATDGFGVDVSRNLVIYHRWGTADDGKLERFYVVLNFSEQPQWVELTFPESDGWLDLLNSDSPAASNYKVGFSAKPNWGHIFYKKT